MNEELEADRRDKEEFSYSLIKLRDEMFYTRTMAWELYIL